MRPTLLEYESPQPPPQPRKPNGWVLMATTLGIMGLIVAADGSTWRPALVLWGVALIPLAIHFALVRACRRSSDYDALVRAFRRSSDYDPPDNPPLVRTGRDG